MNYLLTATRKGKTSQHRFSEDDDGHAMLYSIVHILGQSETKEIWARGHISLLNIDNNEIIKEMEAK